MWNFIRRKDTNRSPVLNLSPNDFYSLCEIRKIIQQVSSPIRASLFISSTTEACLNKIIDANINLDECSQPKKVIEDCEQFKIYAQKRISILENDIKEADIDIEHSLNKLKNGQNDA